MKQYQKYPLETVFRVTDLVNISYYKLPRGYEFPGETHDFWEFVYVDRGELLITAGSSQYPLRTGELAFHCPNEFHSFRASGEAQVNIIVVSFACASPCMRQFEHKLLLLHPAEKQCLSAIVKESENSFAHFDNDPPLVDLRKKDGAPFGGDQLIQTSLEQFLIYIYRRGSSIRFDERAVSANQLRNHAQVAAELQAYLDAHYAEKLTLESLAARMSVSVSQLKRVFKEQVGTSVIPYLTNLRVSEARRLIRESNLNFSQIAERVGYENIYYFSTLFKRKTGMTLTEYSRSLRP